MKGYKAFNKDLVCKGMQYEIGHEYTYDGEPILCKQGYHFCKAIADCYKYYPMSDDTRICEIEALGDIKTDDEVKYCTNHIKIVKEITDECEMKGNTGSCNMGYCNTGICNKGYSNTGSCNTGYHNTGDWNTGYFNTGYKNTGNCNTGSRNIGNYNTGDFNTGDYNTGYWNTGYRNTGNCNTGNCNTGHFNTGNHHCGVFNTEMNRKIEMFNKESNWTFYDWKISKAKFILGEIPMDCVVWIDKDKMTDDEKKQNPSYSVVGGYLKKRKADKTPQEWWDSLCEEDRNDVMSLPNFDADVFYECTGIKVQKEEEE